MSESPSSKREKKRLTSTKASRRKPVEEVKESDKQSINTRKKKEELDSQESFSITYSEEEFKDPKKKCQIS